jgi:hypothetical protein
MLANAKSICLNDMLSEYDVTKLKNSPARSDLFELDESSPRLNDEDAATFRSRVAKILYLAKRCRPDCLLATSFLATRVTVSTVSDLKKLNYLLAYLNSTRDLGIILSPRKSLQIHAYIDASYGIHENDRKSQTGVFITLGGGPIYVESTRQSIIAKSSSEAELVGMSDGLTMVVWTRNFLYAQGHDVGPAILMQDNQSAIALAEKGFSTSKKTRHIDIKFFWVKERIDLCEVQLLYMPTSEMTADILTKAIVGSQFVYLREKLLNGGADEPEDC